MLAAAVASLVSTHASSSTTASRAVPFHSWNSPPTQAALSSWDGEEQTADVVGSIGRQMHLLPGLLTAEEMAALQQQHAEQDRVIARAQQRRWELEDEMLQLQCMLLRAPEGDE